MISFLKKDLNLIARGLGLTKQSRCQPFGILFRGRVDKEATVLSATRTLRRLSVGVGYQVNKRHQQALFESRGIKLLTALAARAENQLLRAEAFYTLACAAICESDSRLSTATTSNSDIAS